MAPRGSVRLGAAQRVGDLYVRARACLAAVRVAKGESQCAASVVDGLVDCLGELIPQNSDSMLDTTVILVSMFLIMAILKHFLHSHGTNIDEVVFPSVLDLEAARKLNGCTQKHIWEKQSSQLQRFGHLQKEMTWSRSKVEENLAQNSEAAEKVL
ncbi:hypothetical protein ABZP36_002019 [Zizania latifolia]